MTRQEKRPPNHVLPLWVEENVQRKLLDRISTREDRATLDTRRTHDGNPNDLQRHTIHPTPHKPGRRKQCWNTQKWKQQNQAKPKDTKRSEYDQQKHTIQKFKDIGKTHSKNWPFIIIKKSSYRHPYDQSNINVHLKQIFTSQPKSTGHRGRRSTTVPMSTPHPHGKISHISHIVKRAHSLQMLQGSSKQHSIQTKIPQEPNIT